MASTPQHEEEQEGNPRRPRTTKSILRYLMEHVVFAFVVDVRGWLIEKLLDEHLWEVISTFLVMML